MTRTFFVTGTDTDVGKTVSTVALLKAAAMRGLKTAGFKPVAAGCDLINGQLLNQDVLQLQQASTLKLGYEQQVGYAFEPHIAPHIAAEETGRIIKLDTLSQGMNDLSEAGADVVFVEGAGGWRIPIGHGHFLSDWVKFEDMPVILVVGARLGCLNHALLTYEAIHHDMLKLAGWCINRIHPNMSHYQANLDTLT